MMKFTLRRGLAFFDAIGRRWSIDKLLATRRVQLIDDFGEICTLVPDELYKRWRSGEWSIDPKSVVNNRQDVLYTTLARDLNSFTPEEQAQALSKLEFIRPLLDIPVLSNVVIERHCTTHLLPCRNQPPSIRSVRRWVRCYKAAGDITQLIDKKPCRRPADDPRIADLFECALENIYQSQQRLDRAAAIAELTRLIEEHNDNVHSNYYIKLPSRATLYRRMQELDSVITDRARFGRFESMRMHRTALISAVSRCILDRIEIDHTRLNVILIDKKTGEIIGRPWLTIAIDVYSKMVYGYYLSFDAPSTNSVLQCLFRGVMPKYDLRDKYPDLINAWPTHGFPVTAVFDNGMDAHANAALDALTEMGVAFVQYCPSRTPWFKGNVERFFRTIKSLIHTLPGTTFSSPKERAGYPAEKQASLDLADLERVIVRWIVDVYHIRTHRTTKTPPLERWNNNARGKDIYLPANLGELQLLLGVSTSRRLFHYGIEFDKIKYNSSSLQEINHRLRKHESRRDIAPQVSFKSYKTTVEYIDVLIPDTKEYLRVHAVDREYAKDLDRQTHASIQKELRERYGENWRRDDQMKVLAEIRDFANDCKSAKRQLKSKLARQSTKQAPPNELQQPLKNNVFSSDHNDDLPDLNTSVTSILSRKSAEVRP